MSVRRFVPAFVLQLGVFLLLGALASGCLESLCYTNADCDAPEICNTGSGRCVPGCTDDAECPDGFVCTDARCVPNAPTDGDEPLVCPDDMTKIAETFCLDRYEASRPDATRNDAGADESRSVSKKGVIPWQVTDNTAAARACEAAGKRLCEPAEWRTACRGPQDSDYAYGNSYDPKICNGIDAFGRDAFRLVTTGAFPDCENGWGAYDLNGNLWEHVAAGSDQTVRGGAYNCADSASLHRCDYIPGTWSPSARGFRCCLSKGRYVPDGDDIPSDVDEDEDGGCIDDPDGDGEGTDLDEDAEPSDGDPDADGDDDEEAELDFEGACPPDMVKAGSVCIDRYEASRPDATDSQIGTDTSRALSRPGVLPWQPAGLNGARAACEAAGKRLCLPSEWVSVCSGPANTAYSYGNTYSAATCNGIDAFCDCDAPACAAASVCPYPHCRATCGADFHVMPTGSFPACESEHGAFDINGNVWELVDAGDGVEHFRGGAYNCGDSEALHRCDYDATWGPSARGFRCCRDPETSR